jgi:hypothetical protein
MNADERRREDVNSRPSGARSQGPEVRRPGKPRAINRAAVQRLSARLGVLCVLCGFTSSGLASPSDLDEFRIKREAVFEFAQKPTVTRQGNRVEIRFETKEFCDVTVAIEEADGRILRHLASGVLGPNAPEPFRKNTKNQVIVWDGKDDRGEYVDDRQDCSVRVSLGLRARYERNLMWCPKKRGPTASMVMSSEPPLVVPRPEGVYVYDGEFMGEHVRLFDHEGHYVRTVYPFPAARVKDVAGLKMLEAPESPGPCPLRWHYSQYTMLTAAAAAFGGSWPDREQKPGLPVSAMAVRGGRLALAAWRVNWLATDAAAGRVDLEGPAVSYPAKIRNSWVNGTFPFGARSAAFDPQGEWLYLTGYAWQVPECQDGLHGVVRVQTNGAEPPQLFAGDMTQGNQGTDDAHLSLPLCVACDAAGRVYVADYMNDRIQVFSPAGEVLKTVRTGKPSHLAVHPDTGELFVFSWVVANERLMKEIYQQEKRHETWKPIPATLTRYESIDRADGGKEITPKPLGVYSLPVVSMSPTAEPYNRGPIPRGLQIRAAVDFWGREPLIWISEGPFDATWYGCIRLLAMKGDRLEVVRDFSKDVEKEDPQPRPPYHSRQRLYFDHRNRLLHVAEQFPDPQHIKSFKETVQIDPESGQARIVLLPFDCEDLAFDMDGRAYLRTLTRIVRYDAKTWQEVPFDYGQEEKEISYQGVRVARDVRAAIDGPLESNSSSQLFGMWVSPKGHVVVTGCHRTPAPDRRDVKVLTAESARRYAPRLYPGRPWGSLVQVFDARGRLAYEDALPGTAFFQGIAMDKDDNLYIQQAGMPAVEGRFPPNVHRRACTLMKLRPGSRVLAPDGAIVPLAPEARPNRAPDFLWDGDRPAWIESVQWLYGGVGISGDVCHCAANSRFAFDCFARSFVSELDRYRLTVLDTNGNVILRIGRYGNADDGRPLVTDKASPAARAIGGDEVSLMQAQFLATETDRRLFVADIGNYRIISVKLDYRTAERVALKGAREGRP